MKNLILILLLLLVCLWSDVTAGTLSVPSPFVLQRPLNPALTTGILSEGFAVSTIFEHFNSYVENNSCETELLKRCHETGIGLLGYKKWNRYYFQLEALSQTSSKEGTAAGTKIKNRRDQQHYLGIVSTQWKNFSLGVMVQNNQFEFRKRQTYPTGKIENGGDEIEWSLSLGGTVRFWKRFYFSLYREEVLTLFLQDVHGRKSGDGPLLGFYGWGLGATYNEFQNWKFSAELYHLLQDKIFERNELLGGQLDVAWKNIASYVTFVYDSRDNYFENRGESQGSGRYAFGIAWYGDRYQVQLGRDPRFFDGLDGGVKLTVGYQF